MRVICTSIDDFLENLTKDVHNIYRKTVYFSITKKEETEVKTLVGIQSSAVIDSDEGGQFIVEAGLLCGYDYSDASCEYIGSRLSEGIKKVIVSFCDDHGLEVRPGIVDY